MKDLLNNLSHYGDILSIPFFFVAVLYFYYKEFRSPMENLLLFFSISGFILDILFTGLFLYKNVHLTRHRL